MILHVPWRGPLTEEDAARRDREAEIGHLNEEIERLRRQVSPKSGNPSDLPS